MLLVFADDWGRHPSSCQHLIRCLLPRHKVVWVNTIGMRAPKLDFATLQRGLGKLAQWRPSAKPAEVAGDSPRVISPLMWPWFGRSHDRWLNKKLLLRALAPIVAAADEPVHAITTIPVVADLIGELGVASWTYYCVDDFSTWPGLDQRTLDRMERELVARCDQILCVSDNLSARIRQFGREPSSLLTHGVDLDHWRKPAASQLQDGFDAIPKPWALFWGLIDSRLDARWLLQLADELQQGSILLVGPVDRSVADPPTHPRIKFLPAQSFDHLPHLGSQASVLIMPYADLPVTRAMQPLKLKEYLATGKPVVVSPLPAVAVWNDCLDVAQSAEDFSRLVRERMATGAPPEQIESRNRLDSESWQAKARQLEACIYQRRGSDAGTVAAQAIEEPQTCLL